MSDEKKFDKNNETSERKPFVKSKDDYNDNRGGGGRPRNKMFFKKKVCRYCTQKTLPDYKNFDQLRRFVTERGKILPRRITGTCAKHQRAVAREVKKARVLAYLPFVRKQ